MDLSRIHGFKWFIMQVIQKNISQNKYCFNTFPKRNMRKHNDMSMLYTKIKFEIDINNNEIGNHVRTYEGNKIEEGERILN
jgi:hypothetical protein